MWQIVIPAVAALASQRSKQKHERKMARQASGQKDYTPIVLGVLGLVVVNKVFGSDKEDKEEKKETDKIEKGGLKDNPFSVATYKLNKKEGYSRKGANSLDLQKAAKRIYNAIGYVSDDESEIMSAIKTAKTKIDIYIMSAFYEKDFKRDLYTDLKKNLGKSELAAVNSYVNKLPEYIKGPTN